MSTGFWKPSSSSQSTKKSFSNSVDVDEDSILPAAAFNLSSAPLLQQQRLLPIYKHKKQIAYAVEEYSVVVIVGETGSGKSTQIPQYLVEHGWADNDYCVVCTQPRRIAATTLAKRVAQEMGTQLGDKVGYSVRFDEQTSTQTIVKYVTEGMLLREATIHDPLLSKYAVVICDEVQERNLDSDMLLGLLKKIRMVRKELRIVICSATIDAQKFLDFFIDNEESLDELMIPINNNDNNNRSKKRSWDIPNDQTSKNSTSITNKGTIISVDGRQYPVDVLYLNQPTPNYITSIVETCWYIHTEESIGDILCFLPTGEAIDNAIQVAEEQFQKELHNVEMLPLYGNLPYNMQARVFLEAANITKSGKAKRRMIFATNIAETSVTIPNIRYVVDSGLVKLPYFDPTTALDRLIVTSISQASARQRAGRAGRIQSGKCYRLYTEKYLLESMQVQNPPEIQRSNLTSFVLTLKALGVDNLLVFDLIDPPSKESLMYALDCLYALGAIDDCSNLTTDGLNMSVFPTDAKIARMLLESLKSKCSWEVLSIAGALQVRDLFIKPRSNRPIEMQRFRDSMANFADSSGDHVSYVTLLADMDQLHYDEEYCRENFINFIAAKRAIEIRSQLARFLRRFGRVESLSVGVVEAERSKIIRRCVTAGYFLNVAKLGNNGRYYTLNTKVPVTPSPSSLYEIHGSVSSEYIVYGETMDGPRGGIELRHVSRIEARWLHEIAPHYWK